MTKRQIAFGVICFLGGILVGMELAGKSEVLVRLVIIVAILLVLVSLALPYLPRGTSASLCPVQRTPQRRTGRKP